MRSIPIIALLAVAPLAVSPDPCDPQPQPQNGCQPPADIVPPDPSRTDWQLYAVEYARSPGMPISRLVVTSDTTTTFDMSWIIYVAVGHGRVVLIDSGMDAPIILSPVNHAYWKLGDFRSPADAVGLIGIAESSVTDVIITHKHSDHTAGMM
jgi:glyoxylase-like metal-dependent hydrolase (beta-lactamase superfamily II)